MLEAFNLQTLLALIFSMGTFAVQPNQQYMYEKVLFMACVHSLEISCA